MEKLLSKKEVAGLLAVSAYTVDTLVRNGNLTCYKIGKLCRYCRKDVEEYLSGAALISKKKEVFATGNVSYKPGMKLV